ncbi:MAG: hypothetical protein V4601_09825 [Pseudomonadota bacterium]
METDRVVFLAQELRRKERALRAAIKRYDRNHARENGDTVNSLLCKLKVLHREFFETVPTSMLGASEMVRMAALCLPFSQARHTSHFHQVADRLRDGQREHADLVWLRAMHTALKDGKGGAQGAMAAPLLDQALKGAARPILVFHAFDADIPAPHDEGTIEGCEGLH